MSLPSQGGPLTEEDAATSWGHYFGRLGWVAWRSGSGTSWCKYGHETHGIAGPCKECRAIVRGVVSAELSKRGRDASTSGPMAQEASTPMQPERTTLPVVYALIGYERYEPPEFQGVYSTRALAEQARDSLDKPHITLWVVYPVEVDAAPRVRLPSDEDVV